MTKKRSWLLGVLKSQKGILHIAPLLTVIAAVGVIAFLLVSSTASFKNGVAGLLNSRPFSFAAASYVQRVNVASNSSYTDNVGNVWAADKPYSASSWGYTTNGYTYSSANPVASTSASPLYQKNHHDTNFEYRFDVPNGSYQVTLKFAEIYPSAFSVGRRVFNVAIEGTNVLQNFDVYRDVGGNTADDKTFTVTVNDGQLNINFTGLVSHAEINAIEVLGLSNPSPVPTVTPTATPTALPTPTPVATPNPTATPAASPSLLPTTFGYTKVGTTVDSGNSNDLTGNRITPTNAVTITSVSGYVDRLDPSLSNQQYQYGVYTDNNGQPGSLVTNTAIGNLVANSWNTLPIKADLLANISYWLMYNSNGSTMDVNNLRKDSAGVNQGGWSNSLVNFGSWPQTFPSPILENSQWSLYASASPDFTLDVTPTQQTIGLNGSTTFDADVKFIGGFTSNSVTLSVTGLPNGVTGVFSPNPLPHEATSQLFLTSNGTVTPGSYRLTIIATANGISHPKNATLIVNTQPDFTLNVTPSTQGVTAGNSIDYQVSAFVLNNFSSPVNMSVSGLPAGATSSFTPNPLTPGTPSTLRVTTASTTASGTYALTISGTGGGNTRSTTANMVVSGGRVWSVSTLGNTGVQNNSAILGNARNDGINRLYVGTISTGQILEYSWSGSSWGTGVAIGTTSGEIHNMGMGPGRGDGVNRLYGCSLGGSLYELTYSTGAWSQQTITDPNHDVNFPTHPYAECTHAAIGNGRNDGINRLYATRGESVYEYTWNGTRYTEVYIGSVSTGRTHGIVLGPGRNGSLNGIYVATSAAGTFEGFFSGGSWTWTNMGDSGDIVNMYIGVGRNDGIRRVYAAVRNPGLVREFSWNGTIWNRLDSQVLPEEAIHADITTGRGDAINRIYVAGGFGNAYELSWNGSSWNVVTLGGGTSYMYGFVTGNGRNDGITRLYGASFDNHVYEYSF